MEVNELILTVKTKIEKKIFCIIVIFNKRKDDFNENFRKYRRI